MCHCMRRGHTYSGPEESRVEPFEDVAFVLVVGRLEGSNMFDIPPTQQESQMKVCRYSRALKCNNPGCDWHPGRYIQPICQFEGSCNQCFSSHSSRLGGLKMFETCFFSKDFVGSFLFYCVDLLHYARVKSLYMRNCHPTFRESLYIYIYINVVYTHPYGLVDVIPCHGKQGEFRPNRTIEHRF